MHSLCCVQGKARICCSPTDMRSDALTWWRETTVRWCPRRRTQWLWTWMWQTIVCSGVIAFTAKSTGRWRRKTIFQFILETLFIHHKLDLSWILYVWVWTFESSCSNTSILEILPKILGCILARMWVCASQGRHASYPWILFSGSYYLD